MGCNQGKVNRNSQNKMQVLKIKQSSQCTSTTTGIEKSYGDVNFELPIYCAAFPQKQTGTKCRKNLNTIEQLKKQKQRDFQRQKCLVDEKLEIFQNKLENLELKKQINQKVDLMGVKMSTIMLKRKLQK